MKLKLFSTLLILSAQVDRPAMSQTAGDSFTIFCTGNQDSTGSCLEVGDSEEHKKLECIMVPGNIIDCKNESEEQIECILIAATSAQAEFSCIRDNTKPLTSVETTSTQIPDDQESLIYNPDKKDFDNGPVKPRQNIFNNPFKP